MKNKITPLMYPEKNDKSEFKDLVPGHVGIRTTRYNEVIKWYQEKLDFRLVREWTVGELQLAFIAPPNNNEFLIEIIGDQGIDKWSEQDSNSGWGHFAFNVDDFDNTIEVLNRHDIEITRSFSIPAIGKRSAFIKDPLGKIIEFCGDM